MIKYNFKVELIYRCFKVDSPFSYLMEGNTENYLLLIKDAKDEIHIPTFHISLHPHPIMPSHKNSLSLLIWTSLTSISSFVSVDLVSYSISIFYLESFILTSFDSIFKCSNYPVFNERSCDFSTDNRWFNDKKRQDKRSEYSNDVSFISWFHAS